MGNDRCGSGGPLKRSYVITGSDMPFEQGLMGGSGGGGGGVTLPGVETRPGNAANLDPTDSTHLSAWS